MIQTIMAILMNDTDYYGNFNDTNYYGNVNE